MKLSKWIDGKKFKPAHVGVYETDCGFFRYWNGGNWGGYGSTAGRAVLFYDMLDIGDQSPTFRGLAKNPEVQS